MRSVRTLRVWLTSAVLIVLGVVLAFLASPAASAGSAREQAVSAASTAPTGAATTGTATPSLPPGTTPRMLASTGLDITVPVVVGLAILVLGTVMVGWAFLATGRRDAQPAGRHR
jgi:hypothetical protein